MPSSWIAPARRSRPWRETVLADLRHALRYFRRTPWATITMISVLSLGLGTNVVLLTLANSLSTLPPPGMARDPALVRIRGTSRAETAPAPQERLLSWPEIEEYSRRGELFSSVVALADESGLVTTNTAPASFSANLIYTTANYFTVLNVPLSLGIPPAGETDIRRMGTSPTAVISYRMWEREFGAAADVIGQVVRINDHPVEISGVAPRRFAGTGESGALTVWLPLAAYPWLQRRTPAVFSSTDSLFLTAVARLRPGVTVAGALPTIAGIAERLNRLGGVRDPAGTIAGASPPSPTASADVAPLLAGNSRVGDPTDRLVSVAASGGFGLMVLLITCANVSALLVGLAVSRRREIGVRFALGASRHRVIRQLLSEGVLLALGAATVGLALTMIGAHLVEDQVEGIQLVVDWRVAGGTVAVAVATGILFSLSPAWHATRMSLAEVLKRSGFIDRARSRLQRALVVGQIALTQPLLVGLGVLVATLGAEQRSAATSGALDRIAEIELDTWGGRVSPAERADRIAAVVERVAGIPGVTAAMPMQMGTIAADLTVPPTDRVPGAPEFRVEQAALLAAPKGYFDAFGLSIVRGRDFTAGESVPTTNDLVGPGSFQAVIVDRALARRFWGAADPIGRRLSIGPHSAGAAAPVVVGVVDDGDAALNRTGDQARLFVPYAPMNTGVIARTVGPALPLLNEIRRAVAAAAPELPIHRAETAAERQAEARRLAFRASGAVAAAGLLAMGLSAIGLYAVMAFVVGARTREIGIRTALGARPALVVRMFFKQGLALSAVGLFLGLPLSLVATRVVSATLRWPLANPPLLTGTIVVSVLAVGAVAAWIPARRASGVESIKALRVD